MKQKEFLKKINHKIIDKYNIVIYLENGERENFYRLQDEYCHAVKYPYDKGSSFSYNKGYKKFSNMLKNQTIEKDLEIVKIELRKFGKTEEITAEELFKIL